MRTKKVKALLWIFLLLSMITGCNKSIASNELSVNRDFTITIENPFDISRFSKKQIEESQTVFGQASMNYDIRTKEEMIKSSETIVKCVVKNVTFTVKGAIPFVVADVQILDSLKGNYLKGDLISIITQNGYMTLQQEVDANDNAFRFPDTTKEEREKILIQKKIDPGPYPEIGEEYVLFLEEQEGFGGALCIVNEHEGRYKLQNNNTYKRFWSFDDLMEKNPTDTGLSSFTCETLKEEIKKHTN